MGRLLGADFVFSLQTPAAIFSGLLLLAFLAAGAVLHFDRRIWEPRGLSCRPCWPCRHLGAISGPDGRYESRMFWLVPLLLFLAATAALKSWRERQRPAAVV